MPITGDTTTAEAEEEPAAEANPGRKCSIPAPLPGCTGLSGANKQHQDFLRRSSRKRSPPRALPQPWRSPHKGTGKSFLSQNGATRRSGGCGTNATAACLLQSDGVIGHEACPNCHIEGVGQPHLELLFSECVWKARLGKALLGLTRGVCFGNCPRGEGRWEPHTRSCCSGVERKGWR